jgi:M6 family metalloprotease-like protein
MRIISFCIVIIVFIATASYSAPPNPKLFLNYNDKDPLKPRMSIANMAQMQMLDPDVPRMNYTKQSDGIEYVLVLRVDFSDQIGKKPASTFDDAIFGKKGTSMYLYYNEVSYGQMQILPGYLDGAMPKGDSWYRASKKMSYYGAGSIATDRYRELSQEACTLADADVDFSKYDRDNDGFVDHLIIIHSGNDEASTGVSNDIWSAVIDSLPGVYDGKRIESAMIVSEDPDDSQINVGIYCHEFFHEFGAPDLYAFDYPVGYWCLMGMFGPYLDNGQHPAHICSYLKWDFDADRSNGIRGWLEPIELKGDGTYSVDALELPSEKHTYKVDIPGKYGEEYFLIENRNNKIGSIYDTYLPESGILIWHIDENQPKSFGFPHRAYVEDPNDPDRELNKPTSGAAYSAEDRQTEFTPSTYPNSNAYDDTYSGIIIADIGSKGTTMNFSLFLGDTYEPNNSIAQAYGPIEFGKRYMSFIWYQNDLDFYYFGVEANTINTIYLENIPDGIDYELRIYDEQGNSLFTTNESGQSTRKISFNSNKSAVYYVAVASDSGFSSSQHYYLTVDSVPANLTPGMISLLKVYPNPGPDINNRITFGYRLLEPVDKLTLDIYTQNGVLIYTQSIDTVSRSGKIEWDTGGLKLSSGVYIYVLKIETDGKTEAKTGKIAILK